MDGEVVAETCWRVFAGTSTHDSSGCSACTAVIARWRRISRKRRWPGCGSTGTGWRDSTPRVCGRGGLRSTWPTRGTAASAFHGEGHPQW